MFPDIIEQPTYTITLPSTNKKIKFRPFLEKERKILLMAMESNDDKEITHAIKNIVRNCCLDKIDVDRLPIIDIEYFFLQLRAKSISEILPLAFRCEHVVDDKPCKNHMELKVDLTTVSPENLKTNKIVELSPKLKVQLNYPSLIETDYKPDTVEFVYEVIANCIVTIFNGEDVYNDTDYTPNDFKFFLEHLTPFQFQKLEDFVADSPKLRQVEKITCNKCGFEHTVTLEGLQSFFV